MSDLKLLLLDFLGFIEGDDWNTSELSFYIKSWFDDRSDEIKKLPMSEYVILDNFIYAFKVMYSTENYSIY